jgi:hypothetical protein
MASPYTDLTDATAFVISLTTVKGREAIIQQKLIDSAGTLTGGRAIGGVNVPSGATIYRPYYVAARLLQQNRTDQALESADGAKFTGMTIPIESFMTEQRALDASLNLEIPPGFAALVDPSSTVMSILAS